MYLLNHCHPFYRVMIQADLHSTMYLLNRSIRTHLPSHQQNLHSTMYLLNRPHRLRSPAEVLAFTFHYVSIKSMWIFALLILLLIFTFHYVSIKSVTWLVSTHCPLYLHSTMYLLNLIFIKPPYNFFYIYIPLCIY